MRQPWLLALVLLPACIVAHPRRAAPPPPRPAHPVVVAPPPSRPPPPVIVHPQVAIDAQGAASIAQCWAWQ
ncbi:MAG: hypothetical protein HY901_04195 [Deltaproteobacteria bacterium]|nr:hypothetical protein [Deltaproteobacteria bacterium]